MENNFLSLFCRAAGSSLVETEPEEPPRRIAFQWSPLIGGPSWLPLHVKLSIEAGDGTWHQLDFVPTDATNPEVTGRLIALQCVPGDVRYAYSGCSLMGQPLEYRIVLQSEDAVRPWRQQQQKSLVSAFSTTHVVDRAVRFAASYPDRNLHLLTNNCWTFALRLYLYLASSDLAHVRGHQSATAGKQECPLAVTTVIPDKPKGPSFPL
jgi:hypothetical protein